MGLLSVQLQSKIVTWVQNVNVKFTLEKTIKAQMGSRGIAQLFL